MLALPTWLERRIPPTWAGRYYELRSRRIEQPHLERFQEFYAGLPDQRDPFYVFFTSGLLHWLHKNLSLVPPQVNLVLVGAGLTPEEVEWLQGCGRPFHHIDLQADDKTVWRFLVATNRHSFGWLDVDCFVFKPGLFREMADIGDDVFANCAWSFEAAGRRILQTYFLFLNTDALRAVQEKIPVSSNTYSYDLSRRGRPAPYGTDSVLTPEILERLSTLLPMDAAERPVFLSEASYYDTLQVFQLLAESYGYRLHRVRDLDPVAHPFSNELVHISKVSYYRKWKRLTDPRAQETYRMLLQVDYLVLQQARLELPWRYDEMFEEILDDLEQIGLSRKVDKVRSSLARLLMQRGADPETLAHLM